MRFATVKLSDIATDLAVVSSLDGKTWQQIDFTCSGYEWARSLKAIIEKSFEIELGSLPRMDVDHIDANLQFEIPVRAVEKIICIGKNYSDHAAEMGGGPPEIPVVFSKFSSSLLGPGKPIVLPSISGKVDFEAELVVVIGRAGRNIRRSDALRHVFGTRSAMTSRRGTCKNSSLADSGCWVKKTPSGVGAGRTPPVFLKPGDHLAVSIQGVGRLENPEIASS